MSKLNIEQLERRFNPDDCLLSAEAIIADGFANRVLSTNPFLRENNTFPGKIIAREGSFWRVRMENGAIVTVKLR